MKKYAKRNTNDTVNVSIACTEGLYLNFKYYYRGAANKMPMTYA